MGIIILSALVAHTAWHWMTDRWGVLSKYRIQLPEVTPAFLASVLRWMMAAVAIAGVWWLVRVVRHGRQGKARKDEGRAAEVVDRV
jgi:TRAP-type C4-dicarboxylate transport system permease small subunit